MEAIARGKNLRGSARKARLVLDLIRGKKVNDAQKILFFSNKGSSFKVGKILDSAIANLRENKGKADLANYVVSKAYADDGPIMRRYMPRAQGRATIVRKRTCHITLALSPVTTDKKKVSKKNDKTDKLMESKSNKVNTSVKQQTSDRLEEIKRNEKE